MDKIYYGKIKIGVDIDQVINDLKKHGCSIRKQYTYIKQFITFSGDISLDILHRINYFEIVDEIFNVSLHSQLSENNRSFNTYYNWGLDRISKPSPVLMKNFDEQRTGKNVQLYIMDTGIMMSHWEFNGRVYPLYDAWRYKPRFPEWRWWIEQDPSPYTDKMEEATFLSSDSAYYGWPGNNAILDGDTYVPDDHGTHVAGIAAGRWCGVAFESTIWSVRIFNGDNITTNEHVMDGAEAILTKHISLNPSLNVHDRSQQHLDQYCGVVNMSFGGPRNLFWESIIHELIDKGLVVVVSAGNGGQCASIISPASTGTSIDLTTGVLEIDVMTKPICVGSSMYPSVSGNYGDVFASWCNWGDVIDIIAPGDSIVSASFDILSDNTSTWEAINQYRNRTGSSQSSPFVAGVSCLILQQGSVRFGPGRTVHDPSGMIPDYLDGISLINDDVRQLLLQYSYDNMFEPQSLLHRVDSRPRNTPNKFLYLYYIDTDLQWYDGNQWDITLKDDSTIFYFKAFSQDAFGLNVRVDYKISNFIQLKNQSSDPDFSFPHTYEIVKTKNSLCSAGCFDWSLKLFLAPPLTSMPLNYIFNIVATDGKKYIQKQVTLRVLAKGESLIWNYPDEGLISPIDSRYIFTTNTNPGILISADPENEMYAPQQIYRDFKVSDINNSYITYQVIPSESYLPPGVIFSMMLDGTGANTAVMQGSVGVIPKNISRYDFVIRATNANNLILDRSFYFLVQQSNLLHQFNPDWLIQVATDYGYEIQQNHRVYYLADIYQGGQVNVQLVMNNPDNDVLSYSLFKINPSSMNGTPNLADWSEQYVPTPYYDANCVASSTTTCFPKFTMNRYYRVTSTQVVPSPLPVYDGILPNGISLDPTTGIISGMANLNANVGLYYFKIMARDGIYGVSNYEFYDQITCSFRIQVNPISFAVISTNIINWVTDTGHIGDVWELYPSHLRVEANTIGGGNIEYSISGTSLPQGLQLNIWSGYIIGIIPAVSSTQTVSFIVRVSIHSSSGVIISDRKFSFVIHKRFALNNFLNFSFPVIGNLRKSLMKRLWIEQYLSVGDLFQPSAFDHLNDTTFVYGSDVKNYQNEFVYPSSMFGIVRYPTIYVVSGLNFVDPNLLVEYLKNYHHRIKLVLGNLNYAIARDPNSQEIYDVIYFDVIDTNAVTPVSGQVYTGGFDANGKEIESDYPYQVSMPHPPFSQTYSLATGTRTLYFEQSIRNMRLDLMTTTNRLNLTTPYNGIGMATNEMFPSWMESTQSDGTIPGFKLALLVAYVNSGKGNQVLNTLKAKGFHTEFLGSEIDVSGYVINGIGFGADSSSYTLGSKFYKFPS